MEWVGPIAAFMIGGCNVIQRCTDLIDASVMERCANIVSVRYSRNPDISGIHHIAPDSLPPMANSIDEVRQALWWAIGIGPKAPS